MSTTIKILQRRYGISDEQLSKAYEEDRIEVMRSRIIAVYAQDWNQYSEQHNPVPHSDYAPAIGWVIRVLVEETSNHITIASTIFDSGQVRNAVVVPKCCVIHRITCMDEGNP